MNMASINCGKIKKIILFGGGRVLRHLAKKYKQEFEIFVFTSSRLIDEKLQDISFRDFLEENKIKYFVTGDITNDPDIKKIICEDGQGCLGLSFGAPWIFKEEFINLFKGKLFNLHSRDLPRNRGGGGASWGIMNDDRKAANVLHMIDAGIDTGDIVKRKYFTFPESCKVPFDYDEYTAETDKKFMEEFISEVKQGKSFERITQKEEESTYFPRLHTATQGIINWDWESLDIVRFIDAFDDPYIGASTYWKDKKVFLKKCELKDEAVGFHPFMSGLVYRVFGGRIFVASKPKGIAISDVKDENGVSVIDKIKIGDRFVTPQEELEKAKKYHPVYTPEGLKQAPAKN
jgi:methionyl-tRNA formyltransferase